MIRAKQEEKKKYYFKNAFTQVRIFRLEIFSPRATCRIFLVLSTLLFYDLFPLHSCKFRAVRPRPTTTTADRLVRGNEKMRHATHPIDIWQRARVRTNSVPEGKGEQAVVLLSILFFCFSVFILSLFCSSSFLYVRFSVCFGFFRF